MTTATSAKPTNVVAEHERLLAAEQKATDKANDLSREHFAKHNRLLGRLDDRGAVDELNRLRQREPEQFAADGTPKAKTPAGRLQAEIDKLQADLAKSGPEVEQARRVKARAEERRREFEATHTAAIVESRRPAAEAARADFDASKATILAALDHYIGQGQGTEAILVTRSDLRQRVRVPGWDAAVDLKRTIEAIELPVPIPEVSDA